MSEIIIEISKESKIKSDFSIEVCIEDGTGSIFHNLPKNYSKEDVIQEYELGIRYDIRTLFEDCYIMYLTEQEKEMVKNKLSNGYELCGIYVRIDNELHNVQNKRY